MNRYAEDCTQRLTRSVKVAMLHTLTDIGQLTAQERKELAYAVRRGWLVKGLGGGWPVLKTVYALPGFDFAADRKEQIAAILAFDRGPNFQP